MAIAPKDRYPGQTIAGDTSYPYGKARDIGTSGDGSGTPWEKDLVNDFFGFFQAILVAAAIVPTGISDTALVSQYLDAIKWLTKNIAGDLIHAGNYIGFSVSVFNGVNAGGPSHFSSTVRVDGDATFNGDVLATSKAGRFKTLVISALSTLLDLTVTGATTLAGQVTLNGADNRVFGPIKLFAGGKIVDNVVYSPNTDLVVTDSSATMLVYQSGTVAASHVTTLNDTTIVGSPIILLNYSSFTQDVHNQSGASIATVPAYSSGVPGFLRMAWISDGASTQWHVVRF